MSSLWGLVAGVMVASAILSLAGVIHNRNRPATVAGIALVTVVVAALMIAGLRRNRIVLYPDAIDVYRDLWPRRRVLRHDVVAREFHPGGWRRHQFHVLITRDGKWVALPIYLEHHAALQDFLKGLPLQSWRRRG